MMKLEAGKAYMTREGEVIEIISLDDSDPVYPALGHNKHWYTYDGRMCKYSKTKSDLVVDKRRKHDK